MRLATPFQTIAVFIALYGAFIFRESWIQYLRLSGVSSSLQTTHHGGGANFTNTSTSVLDATTKVSSLRKPQTTSQTELIRHDDDENDTVALPDKQIVDEKSQAPAAQASVNEPRTNSTARIPEDTVPLNQMEESTSSVDQHTAPVEDSVADPLEETAPLVNKTKDTPVSDTVPTAHDQFPEHIAIKDLPGIEVEVPSEKEGATEELSPLRICRDSEIALEPNDDPLFMRYQCQGPNYNAFSQQLMEFMNDATRHPATWGRRSFPLPDNTSILIFGNSHTGQTAKSFLCQYKDEIKSLTPRLNGNEGFTVEFTNGAVVESLINSYALYGHNWKDLIEKEIDKSLDSFDALVLGKFNHLKDSQNTTFYKQMEQVSQEREDVDFFHIKPPSLEQVAAVYSGNIVAVSMFSNRKKALRESKLMRLDKARLVEEGRTNIRYINGRKFVKILGVEGGSHNRLEISDSVEDGLAHRCNGVNGGYPDLMAWEVIEKLYDLLLGDDTVSTSPDKQIAEVGESGSSLPPEDEPILEAKTDGTAATATVDPNTDTVSVEDSNLVVSEEDKEEESSLPPLRICRDTEIVLDPDDPLFMGYQCQGPNYDAFSQHLTEYISDTTLHTATWGRRPFPLPANKSVFFIGNSHTRQTALSFLCQYKDEITQLELKRNGNEGYKVEFKNGAIAEALINNYALFGYNWNDLIEKEINRPLDSFDAMVLGKFNRLKDSMNTTFFKQMEEVSKENPDVDFFNVKPPNLRKVADVYSGNIVAVGMFSNKPQAEKEAEIMAKDEAQLHAQGRMNVHYIYGRKFIDILGMEGGSMNRLDIGDSFEEGTAHRCFGANGGHPDLMAWEVIENLYDLLSDDK